MDILLGIGRKKAPVVVEAPAAEATPPPPPVEPLKTRKDESRPAKEGEKLGNEKGKKGNQGGNQGAQKEKVAAKDQKMDKKDIPVVKKVSNVRPKTSEGKEKNNLEDLKRKLMASSHASLPSLQGTSNNAENNIFKQTNLSEDKVPLIDSLKMRETARYVSTDLLMKQVKAREGIKKEMLDYERKQRLKKASQKKRSESSWQRKMQSSPFLVNLVTESQRLDEEHKARLAEEERRQNFMKKRKEKIKTEIILQALTEISDMEKLRLEKRSLLLEEQKVKALLDLERTQLKSANDIVTSVKGEKETRAYVKEQRRLKRLQVIKEVELEEKGLLIEQLKISTGL